MYIKVYIHINQSLLALLPSPSLVTNIASERGRGKLERYISGGKAGETQE